MNAWPLSELRDRAVQLVEAEGGAIDSNEIAAELGCEIDEVHAAMQPAVATGAVMATTFLHKLSGGGGGRRVELRRYRLKSSAGTGVDIDQVHRDRSSGSSTACISSEYSSAPELKQPSSGVDGAEPQHHVHTSPRAGAAWLMQMLAAAEAEVTEAQAFLFAMYRSGAAVPAGHEATLPLSHTSSLLRHLEQLTRENAL